jgi:hypothetical protein
MVCKKLYNAVAHNTTGVDGTFIHLPIIRQELVTWAKGFAVWLLAPEHL